MVSDTLSYTFKSLGEHRVCVNISNPLSWSTKCLSVLVIEPLHSLKVVGLSGGKTISTGHYVLVKGLPLEVNITINAGSFAETIFDFENGSYIHKVKSNHKSIGEQNCTYMLLVSTGHIYTERGLYSLKVTAANAVGQKEAYLTDRFIVQGKITSAKISKRFVTVGMSAVNVDTTGDARDANYTWYFQNRIHSTTSKYILQTVQDF